MAIASPGLNTAAQTVPQACYTTETNQFNKTVFTTPGRAVSVVFNSPDAPIGTDATIADTGVITLADADLTYLFTTTVNAINIEPNDPAANLDNQYGVILFDSTNNTYASQAVAIGQSLTATYKPATAPASLVVLAYTPVGSEWQYPAQLVNSRITVQVVDGYTV